ncbi:MAG: OsmC family protein [Anaerolineae bacterium]|nr:OsmC family protein [Anaerolineae bacterium]
MAVRQAEAVWEGNLREGNGTMKFGTFSGPYTFASRFESGEGTNPEELIGAAHAGCFSMAFSAELDRAGFAPIRVQTTASVHLTKGESGFRVTQIDLVTEAVVPGIDAAKFQEIAEGAKNGCPISQLLMPGATITLQATLAG